MPLFPPDRGSLLSALLLCTALLLSTAFASLCAQPVYVPIDVTIGEPQTTEVDLNQLREAIDPASISIAPAPEHSTIAYVEGATFRIAGRSVGVDRVSVAYCDATAACDTAYYEVTSRLPRDITTQVTYDTVSVPGAVKTFCIDTSELPGIVVTVEDICAEPERTFVEFIYSEQSGCVKYRGTQLGGTDSTCVVVCDDLGFCDTTKIIVTTQLPEPFPDAEIEFYIDRGQSDFTVLDLGEFRTPPTDIENVCVEESGTFVAFDIDADAGELSFEGLEVGTERACVLAKAANGAQKRIDVTVHVVTRSPGVDSIRVAVGTRVNWCFGDFELVGEPEGLFDACPDPSPKVSPETTDDVTCVSVAAGDEVGFQDLCMNLCDAGGRCDLVTLTVEVYEPDFTAPPTANDDLVEVPATNTVTYGILDNDESDAPVTSVTIVSDPVYGTASIDENGRLVYDRNPTGECIPDMLVYELCNANGCDRATVTLQPECDGDGGRGLVKVMQAMSPNNDGVNDAWHIYNIVDYPDNEVRVFNRWGVRVFRTTGYANDWEGTFQDGQPLPDGTYFYHVVVEGGSPLSGYVQIRR